MPTIHNGKQVMRPVNTVNFLSSRALNYGYYPLIRGNTAALFHLPLKNRVTKKTGASPFTNNVHISIDDLLKGHKPLAIAFLGASNNTGELIKGLKSLEADIQVMGGKLLILTGVEPRYLQRALRNHEGLTVFYDEDNTVAELFGLYDVSNPLWQWVSGIERDDIPLPAFYVVSAERQIVYHHIDYALKLYAYNNYQSQPFVRELLTSVYNTAQQGAYQPIQYKSVS